MPNDESELNELQMNGTDALVSALRAAVSTVSSGLQVAPLYSSLLTEVITGFIPNQRIDRIARFIAKLDVNLSELDEEFVKRRLADIGVIDLMEDGIYQAVRAVTDERLNYIALVVKNGIKEEDIDILISKTILDLVNQLNNVEIVILQSYSYALKDHLKQKAFRNDYPEIFNNRSHKGRSSENQLQYNPIVNHYYSHLLSLRLITETDLDMRLTKLGALLLKTLDIQVFAGTQEYESEHKRRMKSLRRVLRK